MKKHLLSVGIIFLFVGLGFQPAFANDNNLSVGKAEEQPRDGTFYRTFGGEYYDCGKYVLQTSDGGYIVVGETQSFGSGNADVWLIKTDSDGNKTWDRTFGGANYDHGFCVQQTTDEGYIITGETYSNVWLIKTDNSGNMEWDNIFGGTEKDIGYSVQQTSDGGYIIVGETWSFGAGHDDVYLIKTDNAGNMMWNKTFGGISGDKGYSVQQTTDGGYIITGETWSFGDYFNAVWLIKTDSFGNKTWEKTFEKIEFDEGYCVQQTSDGGYIIVGRTASVPDKQFIWLIKTDSDGNIVWDRELGWDAVGNYVKQTSDGGYIITGIGFGLIKTDSIGCEMWETNLLGTKFEKGYCVQQTSDEGYVITGEAYYNDVLLIKTDKDGNVRNKAVTSNMLLLRILERFPLLQKLLFLINSEFKN